MLTNGTILQKSVVLKQPTTLSHKIILPLANQSSSSIQIFTLSNVFRITVIVIIGLLFWLMTRFLTQVSSM